MVLRNTTIGGTLDVTGVISSSGDVNFAGTASFGRINISDTISINTASIDELNVTKININNVTVLLIKY